MLDEDRTPITNQGLKKSWERFFKKYREEMKRVAGAWPDETSVVFDYWAIDKHSEDLARSLIKNPRTTLDIGSEVAGDEVAFEGLGNPSIRVRDLVETQQRNVQSIRVQDQKNLVQFDGMVQQATEVMAKMLVGAYRCRGCDNIEYEPQNDPINEQKPDGCSQCEKRSKFDLSQEKSTFIDAQKIKVQDLFDEVPSDKEPGRISVWLQGDLAGEVKAGQLVRVVGVIDSEPRIKGSRRTTTRDFYTEAVNLTRLEDVEMPEPITDEEVREWQRITEREDFLERVAEVISPDIEGHVMERVAIALSLVGGVGRSTTPDVDTRGDIHLLLIGDPGLAKSELMTSAKDLVHGATMVDAKNASKSGLTATVVRDDWTGRWAMDLGAIPLTDRSVCCIDELDKARKREVDSLHEAMEQQTVSVSKAGINASIPARTTIIAGANPEHGYWEDRVTPADQLDFPGTILSRFDMILPFFDEVDTEHDEAVADKLLRKAQGESQGAEIDRQLFRRVIQHARENLHPTLSEEASELLRDDYVATRKRHSTGTVAITPRQLEAMIRIAQAHARLCLRKEATVQDAEFAIDITHYWLDRLTHDSVGGGYDVSLIEGVGPGASQRKRCQTVEKTLRRLEKENKERGEKGAVSRSQLVDELQEYGANREQLKKDIERLKQDGAVYEPEAGLLKVLD